jgi:putative hydrolase of the HAD superfamily
LLKGAIFDLGETLIHLTATWEQVRELRMKAIHEALREREVGLDFDDLKREYLRLHGEESDYAARTLEEIEIRKSFAKLFGRLGVKPERRPEMEDLVRRSFAFELDSWVLFPGVPEMLQQIRDLGLKMGLLSNARNDWAVREIVEQADITRYFDVILTSATVGLRKPRPEPFREMLKSLGIEAAEAVMVGNSMEADVAGAAPLGIRTIRVIFGENVDELRIGHNVTVDPDTTVCAVSDVVPALKHMIASC